MKKGYSTKQFSFNKLLIKLALLCLVFFLGIYLYSNRQDAKKDKTYLDEPINGNFYNFNTKDSDKAERILNTIDLNLLKVNKQYTYQTEVLQEDNTVIEETINFYITKSNEIVIGEIGGTQ